MLFVHTGCGFAGAGAPAAVLPGLVRRLRFFRGGSTGCGFSGAAVPAALPDSVDSGFAGMQAASAAVLQKRPRRRQRGPTASQFVKRSIKVKL
jgi:hypothetical protein